MKEWGRAAGWDIGDREKAGVAWDIEGWEAAAGVVRETSAIDDREGSCRERVKS